MIRALLLLLSLAAPLHADKFYPLFAENTLRGWETFGPAKWTMKKGVLTGGQDGDPKRWGVIQTKKHFKDFELTLDFKIDEHGKYNSGVFLRRPTKKGIGPAYQINIGRGAAGEPVGLYLDQWLHKGDEKDAVRKPREWNRLRIRAIGPCIQVWLNEKSIVDFTHKNPPAYLLKPGPIALQTYGAEGHNGWVQFRRMQIIERKEQ